MAVAVAGTGGTVGTTIYRNTVSSVDSASVNEENSNVIISDNDVESDISDNGTNEIIEEEPVFAGEESAYEKEIPTEAASEEAGDEDTETSPVAEEESEKDNKDKDGKEAEEKEKEEVSENALSENTIEVSPFKMSDKNKKHLAGAVASLYMMSNCNVYNGKVDNEALEAAYLLESGKVLSNKEIRALSGNQVYLKAPKISSAEEIGGIVTLKGSFSSGHRDEHGNSVVDNYDFVLTGTRENDKGVFGKFKADNLVMVHSGSETVEVISSPSVNTPEVPDNTGEPVQDNENKPVQEQNPVTDEARETESTVSAGELPFNAI